MARRTASGSEPLPSAVLFDAVGTLVHLREPVGEVYARLALSHGRRLDPQRVEKSFRKALRELPPPVFAGSLEQRVAAERAQWRSVVRQTVHGAGGRSTGWFEPFFAELFAFYGSAAPWRTDPAALRILADLRARGVAAAVVSNFDQRLHGVLEALGLGARLDTVVLPSDPDAGVAKPDSGIFLAALRRLDVSAPEAACVGDDPHDDLEPARALGMRTARVQRAGGLAVAMGSLGF